MNEVYDKAWQKFVNEYGSEMTPDVEAEFLFAWDECKSAVVKILEQDIQNLDLSFESCDKRYIERIKEL